MKQLWTRLGQDTIIVLLFTTRFSACTIPSVTKPVIAQQVSLHCYTQPNSGRVGCT